MAVADKSVSLILSGTGDVLEPEDGIIGIGSGGGYALAAARALIGIDGMDAEEIVRRAMAIASGICIYTNDKITLENSNTEAVNVGHPRKRGPGLRGTLDRFAGMKRVRSLRR